MRLITFGNKGQSGIGKLTTPEITLKGTTTGVVKLYLKLNDT